MAGSTIGTILKLTTFGESHGAALGCVLDGFPAGMKLSEKDIQPYLDRRRPGRSSVSTRRKEGDRAEILSGVFKGKTTGAPIAILIRNEDMKSADYDAIKNLYRPGHADYTYDMKYGFRDHRGGGRSSGRETAARVAAGAVCLKLLHEMNIDVCAYTKSIGEVFTNLKHFKRKNIYKNVTAMPDDKADEAARRLIAKASAKGDSLGGTIECVIEGAPAGLGEPVFDKLDASLAHAIMSIGAVKAVEVGAGAMVSFFTGSDLNDGFMNEDGAIVKTTNHAGGIMGGISDSDQIVLRAHLKPTPSIAMAQKTVTKNGKETTIRIKGRHDPVIVPRAVVVVECMCAVTLLNAMLHNMSARAEHVKAFYARPNS